MSKELTSKFTKYLCGQKFVLITDNQALLKIFSESKGLPVMSALRMQHYATYLQSFDYEIRLRKSSDHANADGLSRMPLQRTDPENVLEESEWSNDKSYLNAKQRVASLTVVNYVAERGVKLISDFNKKSTQKPVQQQYLHHMVEQHRKGHPMKS